MSIATLKKNAESRYFNKVSSQNTFSLNGTRRNQGYVGQHNLMRSLKRTPYSRYEDLLIKVPRETLFKIYIILVVVLQMMILL